MKRWSLRFLPFALPLALEAPAFAFPEMVRHGYANCVSCHVSPGGGGVLTEYGRELSREVMSAWGKEGEGAFAWGAVTPPPWLSLWASYRGVQLYRDTPFVREGKYISMQEDIEAAAQTERFGAVATIGHLDDRGLGRLLSRRHYLLLRPRDEVTLRAGKFMAPVGLNIPEHFAVTERGLGFDQGTETYNVEAAWLGESWSILAAAVLGRPDDSSLPRERGFAATPGVFFADRYKAGLTYYYGAAQGRSRHVLGTWAILGFTPRLFLLSEIDFQARNGGWGAVAYHRLDLELVQGLHAYLTNELSEPGLGAGGGPSARSYGLGLQFFPRPHFEVSAQWQLQAVESLGPGLSDFAYLMLHFYL